MRKVRFDQHIDNALLQGLFVDEMMAMSQFCIMQQSRPNIIGLQGDDSIGILSFLEVEMDFHSVLQQKRTSYNFSSEEFTDYSARLH